MRGGRSPACGVALVALGCVACGALPGGAAESDEQLVLTLTPAGSSTDVSGARLLPSDRYPVGSRVAVVNLGRETHSVLSAGLAAAGGPDVAPAGDAVLFAGRRTENSLWAIYESRLGRSPRALIENDTDCIDPAYLAGDRIVMSCVVTDPSAAQAAASWALFTARRDGSDLERITFGSAAAFDPTPLQDGRILFAMGAPGDGARADLYTLNPEGTLLEAFGDGHGDPAMRYRPRQDRSGRVLFVRATTAGNPPQLLLADMNRPADPLPLAATAGFNPTAVEPFDDGIIVVGTEAGAGSGRGVFRIDGAGAMTELVGSVDGLWPIEALPLEVSAAPRGRPRTIDTTRETGLLIAYATARSDGRIGPPSGSPAPHTVRFEAAGASGSIARTDQVAVRSDGSFFAELPADRPVRVSTLSAAGEVIATSAWFWVRPGEARACFGCHEGHAAAPVNRPIEAIAEPPVPVLSSLEPLIARLATPGAPGGAGR